MRMTFPRQLITRLAACSLLTACGGVASPHILVCIVNAPAENRKCYEVDKDFDTNGALKPGAVPVIRANSSIADLNKAFTVDSVDQESPASNGFVDALAAAKTWIKQEQNHLANCKAGN